MKLWGRKQVDDAVDVEDRLRGFAGAEDTPAPAVEDEVVVPIESAAPAARIRKNARPRRAAQSA